jgi:hypothetical protein
MKFFAEANANLGWKFSGFQSFFMYFTDEFLARLALKS